MTEKELLLKAYLNYFDKKEKEKEKDESGQMWIFRFRYFITAYINSFPEKTSFLDFIIKYDLSLDSIYRRYCENDNKQLKKYLMELPGMSLEHIEHKIYYSIDPKCYENHGWIVMIGSEVIYSLDIEDFHSKPEMKFLYKLFKKHGNLVEFNNFCEDNGMDYNNLSKDEIELIELNF